MQKKNATEVLLHMIELLTEYLTELSDISDTLDQQFAYGEKTAYTECLELLAEWENAPQNDVMENVEKVFPLIC